MFRRVRSTLPWILVPALAALLSVAQAQTPLKIGVFDPQRLSEETADGKRVQERLTAMREANFADLASQQKIIDGLQEQLGQQALSLSLDKRASMELDIQRRMLELSKSRDMATQMLQMELTAAQQVFNDKLLSVIDAFGREQGFDLILDRTLVAWASQKVDLTTAITDLYDKMFPPASAAGE